MKIVIDIPKRYYDDFKLQLPILNRGVPSELAKYVIATGTPLPEGYGNLIDINALEDEIFHISMADWEVLIDYINNVPIIIEAESEVEE